jgi:hypothetical protein
MGVGNGLSKKSFQLGQAIVHLQSLAFCASTQNISPKITPRDVTDRSSPARDASVVAKTSTRLDYRAATSIAR